MAQPVPTSDPRRWWVLVVLCLSVLLVSVDNTIVNVALPTFGRELGASTSGLQWIVDGYTLAFAALLLLGGHLGDRFGRRRVLQLGLVGFAVTSYLATLADTTGELVAGRAAMGVSAALVYPATLALLVATFTDRRERATAIGVWSAVTGLAVAIGPVTGGLLLEHFAWSSVFLVNLPVAALALVAGWLVVPESRSGEGGGLDAVGVLGSVAAIGLLVWTTIEAPNHGWTSATTIAGYAGAAVALAGFVAWELRRRHPLLDVRLFGDARFSVASGSIALAFFALFGFIFLITQYFQVVRGYDTLAAGLATLPFAVVIGATSPLAIVAMRAVGTKAVVTAGLLTMAAGFAVAAGTAADSAYWGRVIVAMVLMAGGLGLVTSPATEAVMGALRTDDQAGAGSAVNDTVREVGGTLGVAVVGSVMATVYGPAVRDGLAGLPAAVREAAADSVVAGAAVAERVPGGTAADVVRTAFLDGLSAGSWVCAGVCLAGALAAAAWLPARHRAGTQVPAPVPVPAG
ncbi:DHA2 family efflux MFS transporter permease subunit [Geodermatophilus marinus]|uniref:DHA2 family efflux MFS transporter permease subunit n=1 Tax=Geodermatophilus sp. LHW52908 TaxID=2303986 RepID=UPI000E3C3018|nr:DHA2 family efflux MFS transporter permease subunit [Geodermatophilus sp. LHW52908]RFU19806.1 DHA2 family efflux MFS transporter permease subunit [Geodermatophilus sp. LHW52908]